MTQIIASNLDNLLGLTPSLAEQQAAHANKLKAARAKLTRIKNQASGMHALAAKLAHQAEVKAAQSEVNALIRAIPF